MRQGKIVEPTSTRWYKDDKLHRDNDLPAIEYHNGRKVWIQNGKWHRVSGPAVVRLHDIVEYWVNDIQLTKEEWENHPEVKKHKLQILLDRILREHK
jgi:hypothetical protein